MQRKVASERTQPIDISDYFTHNNGTAEHFFELAYRRNGKTNGIHFVELLFTDLNGVQQHFRIPLESFTKKKGDHGPFNEGILYDGSSIVGSQEIHVSDMLLMPDPRTAYVSTFQPDTVSVVGSIRDARTGEVYKKDPRNIALLAREFLKKSKIADTMNVGPEIEFFLIDRVLYDIKGHASSYSIDTIEGEWNSGNTNHGKNPVIRPKAGYFPVYSDVNDPIRKDMVEQMQKLGIIVERDHHEVASGQDEINIRYKEFVDMADTVQLYKRIVREVAGKHGMRATFMPKIMEGDNGSGMHVHQSLYKKSENLFHDGGNYANLSEIAKHYIAGLLKHAPALCAIIAPTTNSYRRLVPGFEAPVNLVYGEGNRSAAVRIPTNRGKNKNATRLEFRTPDPTADPYQAFSAMLLAGLDGISQKMILEEPFEEDVYTYTGERKIEQAPGSLEEAVKALERDHDFLVRPGVFSQEVIDTLIDMRRKDANAVKMAIHPKEIQLYVDR